MKISYNWLQTHIQEKLPTSEELVQTIIFHAFEVEDVETHGDDTVMEIKVLPDRAGDCLSHYGVAREIAGLLHLTLKPRLGVELLSKELALPVEVKSEVCRRYIAVQIDGVKVGPSPAWLKERLESVGQRSINNVVDATNFILLDSGQPTHAFDRAKIDGGITVRPAKEGEKIVTLSEEEKILKPEHVVIGDYLGALAIAGVKGGKSAEVSKDTTSIVLEIANFDPASTRKAARGLSLVTDAAKRFENNLAPQIASDAAGQLVALIKDVAGGEVVGVKDIYPTPELVRTLSFTTNDITSRLGSTITASHITNVFDAYKYDYKQAGDTFTLTIPYYRHDITGPHDLADEIGRVVGYDTIPATSLPFTPAVEPHPTFAAIRAVKAYLTAQGFSEVMTYVFRPKGDVEVARGPKGKSALRTNLSDGLKESYDLNKANAALLGLSTIKLFEIGAVFSSKKDTAEPEESIHVAYVDGGNIQEVTLEQFVADHAIEVHAPVATVFATSGTFKPWSSYPFSTRDIAVWLASADDQKTFEVLLTSFASEYCIRPPTLLDTFAKDGRTSVAYRLVFQSMNKTLTSDEIETSFALLVEKVSANASFEIR